MSNRQRYNPSDADRELIQGVIDLVHREPDAFRDAGSWLDQNYTTAEIRRRKDETYRQNLAIERLSQPDGYCSLGDRSRAFRQKHFDIEKASVEQGSESVNANTPSQPTARPKDPDGRCGLPPIDFVDRFWEAFDDVLLRRPDLSVLPEDQRRIQAFQQLLMIWLYRDPDRNDVVTITEFQQMRLEQTPDGLPLVILTDAADLDQEPLCIHADGLLRRDAATWLPKVKYALSVCDRHFNSIGEVGSGTVVARPPKHPVPKKPSKRALDAWSLNSLVVPA